MPLRSDRASLDEPAKGGRRRSVPRCIHGVHFLPSACLLRMRSLFLVYRKCPFPKPAATSARRLTTANRSRGGRRRARGGAEASCRVRGGVDPATPDVHSRPGPQTRAPDQGPGPGPQTRAASRSRGQGNRPNNAQGVASYTRLGGWHHCARAQYSVRSQHDVE